MAVQIFILAALLLILPVCAGSVFAYADKREGNVLFRWLGGQFLLWAGFQLICVPFILRERPFSEMVTMYWIFIAVLLLSAAAVGIRRAVMKTGKISLLYPRSVKRSFSDILLWGIFWGVLLFQLFQAVSSTYADGDDAFYVALSSITANSDTMYQILPYVGGATMLDSRHGLAPFPMWIAFLAKASGMRAVTLAHVVLPVVLISMTYGIFYLIVVRLFSEKDGKRPLFLIFTELLVIFGDYSIYTTENFMIARSRQGKAALGSIVIPFLFLLLLILLRRLQENESISGYLYLLLGAAVMTGCLCSSLGALLCGMLVGIAGLLGCFCFRKARILLPLAVCCIPCLCYAFLYMILE